MSLLSLNLTLLVKNGNANDQIGNSFKKTINKIQKLQDLILYLLWKNFSLKKKSHWYTRAICYLNRRPKGISDTNHRWYLRMYDWEKENTCNWWLRHKTVYIRNVTGYNFFSELLSITHVQNSQNYNVGSHISVGFTLVFLVHIEREDYEWEQLHEFTKGKACLANLIAFCEKWLDLCMSREQIYHLS